MKREWPLRFVCAHEGCNESVTYRYQTQRDLKQSPELKWYSGGRWRCTRHSNIQEVLSKDNPTTSATLVSTRQGERVYWGNSGFVYGPGFKAFCNDFPEGTRLIVTATIEFPEKTS